MASQPVNLEYGADKPRRWKAYLRRAVLVGITAALTLAAVRYVPRYLDRWKTFSAQETARSFVPSKKVVMGTAGVSLLEPGTDWRRYGDVSFSPVHPEWEAFAKKLIREKTRIVYLGFHTSPSGNRRIIAVAAHDGFGMAGEATYLGLDIWVYSEGTRTKSPQVQGVDISFSLACPDPEVRIMAGEPDRVDPAKFSINVVGPTSVVCFEATLMDDDSVRKSYDYVAPFRSRTWALLRRVW